jgi:hypothetical protein
MILDALAKSIMFYGYYRVKIRILVISIAFVKSNGHAFVFWTFGGLRPQWLTKKCGTLKTERPIFRSGGEIFLWRGR